VPYVSKYQEDSHTVLRGQASVRTGPDNRYYTLNTYLRARFGCRVQKITIDAGMTCPNRDGTLSTGGCIYCNVRGSGSGAHARGLSVAEQVHQGKIWMRKRYKARKFIAYFQSFSNTYAPAEQLARMYQEALDQDDVVGLFIGTRPDCVNDEVLNLLQRLNQRTLVWMEYGLQSASNITLERINRGHDFATFADALTRTRALGIAVCAHIILGLPGEDRTTILKTTQALANLGVDGVKLHLLYVVSETALARMYAKQRYRCLTQDQYVQWVVDVLERLPDTVVIQRLTGDPHPDELVAPQWALQKAETRRKIEQALVRRQTWQGRLQQVHQQP
jgi:radical SAM protein (TIGR01212 family)